MVRNTPCVRAATAGESGAAGETSAEVCAASRGETAACARTASPAAGSATPRFRSRRAEELARLGQPAGERPFHDAEPLRRVLAAHAIDLAEHDRGTEVLRQFGDLLVEDGQRIDVSFGDGLLSAVRDGGHGHFAGQSAGGHGTSLPGGADGDPIQPGADGLGRADVAGTASEHRERRLEGVVREVPVAGDPAADAQDHRPEPADEVRERTLRAGAGIAAQEFAVGDVRVE